MECPMCWELYATNRIARNLLCGHTYCSQCLESIYTLNKRIECPMCRTKHEPHIKPNLLSKNYVAMDLASKQVDIRKKFEICPSHSQLPLQFFCEDDQTHMCTECIAEHYGHKFFKYEHSASLQTNRVTKIVGKLAQQLELLEKQIKGFDNAKEQLEIENTKSQQILDEQFERLIKRIESRRSELRDQQSKIYIFEKEQIEQDMTFNQSLLSDMSSLQIKLDQKQKELNGIKAIKNNDLIKEIDELEEQVEKDIAQQKQLKSSEIKKLPKLMFDSKIFTEIAKFGSFKMDVINPQICFFGDKHKILIYNIENNDWTFKLMPNNTLEYNYYAAAVSLPSGDIIITGGGVSKNVMLVQPSKGFISQALKSMYFPRKEHACVYLDGFVYAIGGYDGSAKQMLSCCEKYSLASDEWRMIEPLQKQKCAFAAAAAINKFIYVFGGFDGRERLNTIERYSVKDNTWKVLDIKFKQGFSNAAAISSEENKILILGGGSNQGFSYDLQLFDANEQKIVTLSKMNEGRDLRNKLIIFDNNLYACGGNYYSIEKYSLNKSVWDNLKGYDHLIQDNLDSWCSAITFDISNSSNASKVMKHNQLKQQQYQNYLYDEAISFENNDSFNQDAQSEEMEDFEEFGLNNQQRLFQF